eukprot:366587-Heterocapsa_arctica.AAC.1
MGGAHEEQHDHEGKYVHIVEHKSKYQNAVPSTKKRNTEHRDNNLYPGASSYKRVHIRAEQLFIEAQANMAEQKEAATQRQM